MLGVLCALALRTEARTAETAEESQYLFHILKNARHPPPKKAGSLAALRL
jgi:hypothetical protein